MIYIAQDFKGNPGLYHTIDDNAYQDERHPIKRYWTTHCGIKQRCTDWHIKDTKPPDSLLCKECKETNNEQ